MIHFPHRINYYFHITLLSPPGTYKQGQKKAHFHTLKMYLLPLIYQASDLYNNLSHEHACGFMYIMEIVGFEPMTS